MKKFIIKVLIALSLAITLSLSYLYMPEAFFSLDNRLRDFMFIIRGELPKSSKVVIVDIDEKSLQKYGQWPWSRDVLAELFYKLRDAGAGVVGLDIVFAEADRTSPSRFDKRLENYDETLAAALMQTPVIGGYVFTFEKTEEQNTPMIPAVFLERGMQKNTILEPKGIVLNIELLQDSMYSSGFFNNTPDEGGMIRSVPLLMKYDGILYPSLVLEMLRIYSGVNRVEVYGDSAGARSLQFGEYDIPLDKVGRLNVNFRGPSKHFTYISAADILSGDFNVSTIAEKFVLVGTSAVGLYDLRSIPFDSAIAGVEVHANALDNILSGDFLEKPADIVIYDLIIIWIIVLCFFMIFSFVQSWLILPVSVLGLYLLFELFFKLLFVYGVSFNLLFPLIAYFITLVVSVGIDYIVASRQKEIAKRMLGRKVSPAVMEYLLKHSDQDFVASREVEATIFFSDIRSFTTISEKIGSPNKLIEMLNTYMTPMVESIVKRRGTIDKFIGDAIMAYWNAPIKVKNHADMALKSAIEQIELLSSVNSFITPKYDVKITIGIGMHTGIVTAGDMGAEGRSDYTIIGDNVNLTSRLEGLTKQYGADILISNATFLKLTDSYKIRSIDLVEVKGKSEAVEVYEVICSNKNIEDAEIKEYEDAIKFFREGEVKSAYTIFLQLEKEFSSILYQFYLKRCELFLENPTQEFSPILKMSTK
jgi:adenylate cyclase